MTKDEKIPAKNGRRPVHLTDAQNLKLKELFRKNEDTASSAADKVGCSRQYAANLFHVFADELANDRKTNWIEMVDDTLNQAIEGFTFKIEEADKRIEKVDKVYEEVSQVHFELRPNAIAKLNKSPLAQKLGTLEPEEFSQLIMLLRDYLKQYVDTGFLRSTWNNEVRQERIYKTELQMQFDDLKLVVPPSVVIQGLLEKTIAEKLNLDPAIPEQKALIDKKEKPKKK